MPDLPSSLALTSIALDAEIISADHRNNYLAIQTAVNALIAALANGAAGQVPIAVDSDTIAYDYPPGYEVVAPQLYTTDQATTSTSMTDLFTFPAGTFENAKHYFEIAIPNLRASIAMDAIQFRLMEGASPVGDAVTLETHASAGVGVSSFYRMPFTPSAAAHTYKVQWMTVFAGTATIKASVGDATFRIVKA